MSDTGENGLQGRFLGELIKAIQPLSSAVEGGEPGIAQLSSQIGISLDDNQTQQMISSLGSLPNDIKTIQSLFDNPSSIIDIMNKISNIMNGIRNLESIHPDIGTRLLDYILSTYLQNNYGIIYGLLIFFGIIEEEHIPANGIIQAHTLRKIHWERLTHFLKPNELLTTLYQWGTPDFQGNLMLKALSKIFRFGGIPAFVKKDEGSDKEYFFIGIENDFDSVRIGSKAATLPANPQGSYNAGISIAPVGITNIDEDINFGNGRIISIHIVNSLAPNYGLLIRPKNVSFGPLDGSSAPGPPSTNFGLVVNLAKKKQPGEMILLLGEPDGIKLHANSIGLGFGIDSDKEELEFHIDLQGLQLVINPSDADNFLKEILGNQPTIDLDGSMVLSSKTGLHFKGQPGLDMTIPIDKTLGSIHLHAVVVSLKILDTGIDLFIGAIGRIGLGPVDLTIDNIGIKVLFSQIAEGQPQGLFGNYDLTFAFRPPDGLGIAIDSQGLKGGGFIWRRENQYAGVIDLTFRGFAVQALAVLDKSQPEVSFIFAIFADLKKPIELGGGFKINKIGGFVGFNRTVSHDEIASGIKSGILDSILFPDNIIQNAPKIINDFKRILPSQPGQHLIGPALRITYGTPTLIKGDIAIILEFPSPFLLSILGKITSKIPEKDPTIQINIGIVGAIDFTNEWAGLYGSLYDSRILDYTLSGDMAMAASWGAKKNFIFSMGGFNPRFSPPANFPPFGAPPLKRLTVALESFVTMQCYLALTSNTFQVGARIDARLSGGGATLSGFLSFDTLIQFSPLYFIADISAGLSLKYKGISIASIRFSGTLEGPNPLRIKGSVSFSILWWDISVHVNVQFGSKRPQEPISFVDPWPILKDALQLDESWSADFPEWADLGVIIKESSKQDKHLVHPLGTLKVSQRIVPLNHTLSKFGQAEPAENFKFIITGADNLPVLPPAVQDYFAPAQFSKYDNSQKLTLKSFDLMDAGVRFNLSTNDVSFDPSSVSHKDTEYETIILKDNKPVEQDLLAFTPTNMQTSIFELTGTSYQTTLQNNKRLQYNFQNQITAVSVSDEKFLIVDVEANLLPVDSTLSGEFSQATAINRLEEFKKLNPNDMRNLQVVSKFELEGAAV